MDNANFDGSMGEAMQHSAHESKAKDLEARIERLNVRLAVHEQAMINLRNIMDRHEEAYYIREEEVADLRARIEALEAK